MGMNEGQMYEPFLGKPVDVGIPNFIHQGRLFLINGIVIDTKDGYVTLRIKDGFRKIPYSDIISIQERDAP
jgi:hypothetical protein